MKQLSCGRDWHSYKTTDITYYNLNLHFSVWLIRDLQMVSFQLHTEKKLSSSVWVYSGEITSFIIMFQIIN